MFYLGNGKYDREDEFIIMSSILCQEKDVSTNLIDLGAIIFNGSRKEPNTWLIVKLIDVPVLEVVKDDGIFGAKFSEISITSEGLRDCVVECAKNVKANNPIEDYIFSLEGLMQFFIDDKWMHGSAKVIIPDLHFTKNFGVEEEEFYYEVMQGDTETTLCFKGTKEEGSFCARAK